MTLDDEIDISRGDWLVGADEPVPLASSFEADIVWMHETALPWEEVEGLLEALFDACLIFDAPRIRELLEQAPLGYQPQSEPVDLVWEQSTQAPGQAPTPASPGDKVVMLRSRPASTVS